MKKYTFRDYTQAMIGLYTILLVGSFLFGGIIERRTYVVGGIAGVLLVICTLQFLKYKNTFLYQIPLDKALSKEPSMYRLALVGIALAMLSDSKEPLYLAVPLSCAMLNLKYVIMHVQLKNKLAVIEKGV